MLEGWREAGGGWCVGVLVSWKDGVLEGWRAGELVLVEVGWRAGAGGLVLVSG